MRVACLVSVSQVEAHEAPSTASVVNACCDPLSLTRTPERSGLTAEKGGAETGQIADATAIEAKTSERIVDLSRAVRGRPDIRVSLSRALRQRSLKSR